MDSDKKCYEEWISMAKGIAMLAIIYSHIRGGISDDYAVEGAYIDT